MTKKRALVIGATGEVGDALLHQLVQQPDYNIVALARREISLQASNLTVVVDDLNSPQAVLSSALKNGDQFDELYCCLGTTQSKAGSKTAFHAVDYSLIVKWAEWAKAVGIRHFLLVSAMGANADSQVFYLQVKGKTEAAIKALNFPSLTIVQPSLLDSRRQELRIFERAGLALARLTAPVLQSLLPNLAAVPVEHVARAMIVSASCPPQGCRTVHSGEMLGLSND